jgi:hypothetical protein
MTRKLFVPILALAAVLAATASTGAAPRGPMGKRIPPPRAPGVVAYCRAHPTMDYPHTNKPGDLEDNSLAADVAAAGADNWRCMDGKVLVCAGGASGSACQRADPSLKPSANIRDFCKTMPNADVVGTAYSLPSSSLWKCKGKTPVIIHTAALDKRHFLKHTWAPLLGADGRPRKDIDLQADPR